MEDQTQSKAELTATAAEEEQEELPAKHVFLLMKSEYRISRNVRAHWFFSRLDETFRIGRHDNIDDFEEEISVLSVIPCDPVVGNWSPDTARDFAYRLLPSTTITYLARKYKLAFCIDLSPSVVVVDVNSGDVVLDRMIAALRKCLESLVREFVVPGSRLMFTPQVYVTIIAHSSLLIHPNQQVVVQGWLLTASNLQEFLTLIQNRLNVVEDCLASCSSYLQQRMNPQNNNNINHSFSPKSQVSSERCFDYVGDDDEGSIKSRTQSPALSFSPDSCFINLLRYGILALQLLPDDTIAGIVVVTDGVINVPDIHIFQSLLAQLRNSTISCSFLHVTGSQHPSCCWGYSSFPDLMRFIATATYGTYLPNIPDTCCQDGATAMNAYHRGLFAWSFQWASYADKVVEPNCTVVNREIAYNNHNFSLKEDFHLETKKHLEKTIATSLETILSCRLREGYGIQQIALMDGNRLEVSLLLPWKHDVSINYVVSSSWPLESSFCQYKVVIRGSYEFLHDLTCPTKKPIKSIYRSNVVKKFFEALQQLSQTDEVLVHLHSFASNSAYYVIPESIRNGVPLFYLATGSTRPVLCSSDFPCPKFAEFWEPICMLDINIWQKWMHTHRIGIILSHDRPLPKYLHVPSSNGRYNTVQCRQALASLNKLLAEWSSFVLIDNHTYIKLVVGEQDKPPISFYIIRVISQAPCMVIRLAFLGGMPSHDRNAIVSELRKKILGLTSPSRLNLKTTTVGSKLTVEGEILSDVGTSDGPASSQEGVSRTSCCVQLLKPVEKFLIRYERTPVDYDNVSERFTPFRNFPPFGSLGSRKVSSMFSTLGRYLNHQRWVWSAQYNATSAISLVAVARVLGTLIKIRLQEGFHLAHSYCGIVNMVLELQMQAAGDNKGATYPCVLQYVLFPPHVASAFRESLSDEEPELDLASGEVEGELQLVIECWVEPQHGFVASGNVECKDLEGLKFKQLPEALFQADRDCISTLLTFEHLNVMCKRLDSLTPDTCPPLRESPDPSIRHIGFPYDLNRLLAKCPQAQLVFSTLAQAYDTSAIDPVENNVANNLLLNLVHDGILSIHDREVQLSPSESNSLRCLLRRRLPPFAEADSAASLPKWKCYIKGLSSTRVLLTFVPDTFHDLLLLDHNLPRHDDDEVIEECTSRLYGQHFALPVYAVDCSLSALVSAIVNGGNARNSGHNDDFFQDYRPSRCMAEDLVTVCGSNQSDGSSKLTSPEPRTEDSDASSSGKLYWKPHSNCVAIIHSSCFVTAIYYCLQKRIPVCCYDIQSSMEEICMETALEIDITEFLKTVCLHVNASQSKSNQGKLHDMNNLDGTNNKVDLCELTVPSNLDTMGPCAALGRIQVIVQSKFAAIMNQDFTAVDSNPDYYYYNPSGFPNAKSSMSEGMDDFKEEDCETVQFQMGSGPVNEMRHSTGTDMESEDYDMHSSGSSTDGASVVHEVQSDKDVNDDVSPLFIHLTCTISDRNNRRVVNCSMQSLPTCFGNLKSCMSELGWLAGELVDLANIRITLDVLCLTLPPEAETPIGHKESQPRTTSFCSSSSVAQDFGVKPDSDEDELYPNSGYEGNANKDPLGHLPVCQRAAVNRCVDEIKWMLRDEIASFARDSNPISEAVLESVANHVRDSSGRNGCCASYVPLHFVFGPETSLDKFEQEFRHMSLRGYRLLHESSYYYVALKALDLEEDCKTSNTSSVGLTSKHIVVQQRNPHQDDGAELDMSEDVRFGPSCHHRRRSFAHPKLHQIRSECLASNCDGGEDTGAISDGHKEPIAGRSMTNRLRARSNRSKSESDLGICKIRGALPTRTRLKTRTKGTSLREESYQMHDGTIGIATGDAQNSSTEEGYDGDSSDDDDDGDLLRDSDTKHPQLPEFWLIMQVSTDRVDICFQFRDAEHDAESLQSHRDINRQLVGNIKNICKIVNQALLLQDLHDSRMCNQLLEPEANEDIWRQEELPLNLSASTCGRRWSCWLPTNGVGDNEEMVDCQDTYLEATMKFMPGAFTCNIIWEMLFFLHPRLKAGHGRMSISRGVQALKAVLSPLSVNNRKNMFVYKERTRGAVFYLRLHEASSACVNFVSEPSNSLTTRHGMVDESASLGGSRSSSLQSLNVVRNPMDANEELPEPRSRVNSMPEKDKDPSQGDSVSVTSRISGRQRCSDDMITLSVHGITEAGPEIKEDLVKALQNRLDDAILEVISITLARNPMCKLTPEDVQFIQKPDSTPSAVRHFTVQPQMLPYLQVIVYYLRQNLLQFLNVPKYVDGRVDNHFQRYQCDSTVVETDPPAVFLYVMPQEAGSRGVACIVLSVVDGRNNLVCHLDCPLPNPDAYKDGLESHEFEHLTHTSLYTSLDNDQKKTPGPLALIQVQIWEKGKIDLEQLVDRLGVAVRHALWDVITEYRLLTAPLAEMLPADEAVVSSEPTTPVKVKQQLSRQDLTKGSRGREHIISPLFLVQAKIRQMSASVPDLILKCRSPTWSSSRVEFVISPGIQPGSPTIIGSPSTVEEEVHIGMDAEVLRRREKYEVGEKGVLHEMYANVAELWLEFAKQTAVPSVQKHSLILTSRHSVQIVLHELSKLITNLVSDTMPRTFKKVVGFVPFHSFTTSRDRRKTSGMSFIEATKDVPGKGNSFLLIGRNVRHWRASSGRLEDFSEVVDNKNIKDLQRFPPYVQSVEERILVEDTKKEPFFIPRQRLLLVAVRDCEIFIYMYNWAHDLANSLVDESSKLVEIQNMRSGFLSSVVFQKLGLFLNQPASRKYTGADRVPGTENKLGKCIESADLDLLLKSSVVGGGGVMRRETGYLTSHRQRRSAASQHHSIPFCDVLRDAKPHHSLHVFGGDPVLRHGQQFLEIRNMDNRELQKQLMSMWQNREGRICVNRLKQNSRVEHYCFTPILFHPVWRLQLAAARDHTRSCTPVNQFPSASAVNQFHQQIELSTSGMRSRHSSGTSVKCNEVRPPKKSVSVSGVLTLLPKTVSESEKWHTSMYNAYIAEFVQYLQTLGFVGFRFPRKRPQQGKFEVSNVDERESASGECAPRYLQKFLLGGILLLELVLCEPYFGVKMYTLESMRLRALSNRVLNSQFVVAFLDECDKIKVCMHLHSFTYDYHLRSIHSYISGRQMALRQYYHLISFLDDFIQYYQKSPNFARNLVHQGSITIGPTTSSTKQLFQYLLNHDRTYEMRAFKMMGHDEMDEAEYVLVQMSTHKVAYRDSSDTRQMDEFDVSLLIALDPLRVEANALCLKYCIILTSCREMYPKPLAEKQPGTFRTVVTTCLPPSRPPSIPDSRRASLERTDEEEASDSSQVAGDFAQRSFDSRGDPNTSELTDTLGSTSSACEKDAVALELGTKMFGIRQEIVNYLGYFSSHEELMHKIIMEQVGEAKCHIDEVVKRAMVDCRRDSLWERLQRCVREMEDSRRRKDDFREHHGMTCVEFMDLLSLVSRKPLTDIDPRLATFAVMPINWYQTLVKVLLNKYQDRHHHFTASDGNTQHVAILVGNPSNWFVLLSIDLHSNSSELCVVCRESTTDWNPAIYALVEDVVNACCFHMWSVLL